jgi:hypothetical protein
VNQSCQPSPLAPLYGKLPRGWEAWVGVGGLLYARRRKTSPPVVLRAATADELARKVHQRETGCSDAAPCTEHDPAG